MRKIRDSLSMPELPEGIRRLLASHVFLLVDTALVLILSFIWFQSDRASPLIFILILVALVAAFVELYRREARWLLRLSELNSELRHALAKSDTLAEISREFSGEIETDVLFDLVARRGRELLGADYSTVSTVDQATGEIVMSAAVGLTPAGLWSPRSESGRGLVGRAITTLQPVVVEDFGNNLAFPVDEYPSHKAEGMVAALVMPIHRGSKALGGLTIGYRRTHCFMEDELDSIEALAAQAGVALENAMLYGEEKRRVAELEAVLDHMSDGVVVTDRSGRVVRCNETAAQLMGAPLTPGVSLSDAGWQTELQIEGLDGEALPPEEWLLARAAQGDEFTGREATVRRYEAKPRHISVDGRPVLNGKGEVVLGVTVIHDVTAAREMDILKDEFLSLAAHELKTPLTSLKGYAQMLLSSPGESLGELRRHALEVMDQQVDRVNHMVEQFILVEEIRSGKLLLHPDQVDLSDVVARACARIDGTEGGRSVELHIAEGMHVTADAKSLDLVVSNLLENAMKFSPLGSSVVVSVYVEGRNTVVCVQDRGAGIPKDKQGYLFERFYQVQPGTQRGVGLGLYISQELVTSHGGRMWLESVEGEGSRFFFALPLVEARRQASGS